MLIAGATSWGTNEISVDRRTLEAGGKVQRVQAGLQHERRLFSCGVPMTGVDLRIVDADSAQPCEEGHVGEIWLSSPCVTAGYYNRPAVNQKTFQVCNHIQPVHPACLRYAAAAKLSFFGLHICIVSQAPG